MEREPCDSARQAWIVGAGRATMQSQRGTRFAAYALGRELNLNEADSSGFDLSKNDPDSQ
jgi:hypothetical protein